MIYYALLISAAILFSSQFLFQQKYQNECGMTWSATLNFNIYSGIAGFILMWLLGKGHLEFSWFSLGVAIVYAAVNITYNYASLKSFDTVNLSAYSMFAMLGGMLLPFGYGILWNGEDLTVSKIICGCIIAVSLLFTLSGGQSKGKAVFYICLVMQLLTQRRFPVISRKAGFYSIGFAVLCSLGNLFVLIGLIRLPASVQYPIITGGVIVFSTVISLIRRERPSGKQMIAAGLALVATIVIM